MRYRRATTRALAALLYATPVACVLLAPACARAQAGSNAQIGDPFSTGSLDNALKGMRVFRARMADAAALSAQYLANQKKAAALEEANKRQIDEYGAHAGTISECVQAFQSMQQPQRDEQMRKKMMALMSDQAAYQKFIAEYSRLGQAAATAQMKGDTVAARRATNEVMKLIGVDAKADSLAAVTKCGAPSARPAVLDQIDQLSKQDEDLSNKIRVSENSAEIDAARAAGVTPITFAQMRERLGLFLTNGNAFTGKEGDLLKGRQHEIEELLKTP